MPRSRMRSYAGEAWQVMPMRSGFCASQSRQYESMASISLVRSGYRPLSCSARLPSTRMQLPKGWDLAVTMGWSRSPPTTSSPGLTWG